MEIAASTLYLLYQCLDDVLKDLVNLTINKIEIADSGNHSLNSCRVKRLQEISTSYGIHFSIHAPYSDTNLSADDGLIREWILKRVLTSIRFSSELEASFLVVHPGWITAIERFTPGRSWELNLRSLHWLQRHAGEYGVEVLMENVPFPTPYLLVSVDDFLLFDKEMNSTMNYVLDVAHAHLKGEIFQFIETFGSKIKHVHVSDNWGEVDQHLPLGEGNINWSKVLDALDDINYNGWLVIESYEKMESNIEYLKALI
jgi:sugar phosphate isomerase/epimerase